MKRSWINRSLLLAWAFIGCLSPAQDRDTIREALQLEMARAVAGSKHAEEYLEIHRLLRAFEPDKVLQQLNDSQMSPNLVDLFRGWAYHQKGEYREALQYFHRLDEHADEFDDFMANRLVELRRADEALLSFKTLETDNFSIRYQEGRDEVMTWFLPVVLETALERLSATMKFEPKSKIIIELMPDYELFSYASALTKQQIETTGTVALCVENRVVVLTPRRVALGYYWPDVISHEFIHYVMTKTGGELIPLWFHEGVAKFFESTWETSVEVSLDPRLQDSLVDAFREDLFITFEQMHPSFAALPTPKLAQLAYAQSASMIEFLCDQRGTDIIPSMLRSLDSDNAIETQLQIMFDTDIDGFIATWQNWAKARGYVSSGHHEAEGVTLLDDDYTDPGLGQLDQEDEAIKKYTRLGDLLLERNRTTAALKEYRKALSEKDALMSRQMMLRLLICYQRLNEGEAILKLVEEQSDQWRLDPTLLKAMAGAYLMLDRLNEAKATLLQAVRVNPFDPKVHELRRQLAERQSDQATLDQIQQIMERLAHRGDAKEPSKS